MRLRTARPSFTPGRNRVAANRARSVFLCPARPDGTGEVDLAHDAALIDQDLQPHLASACSRGPIDPQRGERRWIAVEIPRRVEIRVRRLGEWERICAGFRRA